MGRTTKVYFNQKTHKWEKIIKPPIPMSLIWCRILGMKNRDWNELCGSCIERRKCSDRLTWELRMKGINVGVEKGYRYKP